MHKVETTCVSVIKCQPAKQLLYILQELLMYKCLSQRVVATTGKIERKSLPSTTVGYSSCASAACAASVSTTTINDGDFVLVNRHSLPDPILALRKVDMTGDGLLEIGVLSLKGLHILQVSFFAFGR